MVHQKWLTGEKITDLGIRGFELFEFVRKGLQPYDADIGSPIPPPSLPVLKSKREDLQKELSVQEESLKGWTEFHRELLEKGEDHPLVGHRSKMIIEKAEYDAIHFEGRGDSGYQEAMDESSKSKILRKMVDETDLEIKGKKGWIASLTNDIAKLTQQIAPLEEGGWRVYEPNSKEEKQKTISFLMDAVYKAEDVSNALNPDQSSPEIQPETKYQSFIQGLRVSYANDKEIKIQEPGKSAVPYDCRTLGFKNERTEQWKTLLRLLQGFDHKFRFRTEAERKILPEINQKLVTAFMKFFRLDIPNDFKLYEKDYSEKKAFVFKFQVGETKITEDDRTRTLDKLEKLSKDYKKASNGEDQQSILAEMKPYLKKAKEQEWLTEDEARDLLSIYNPNAEICDPYEKDKDRD